LPTRLTWPGALIYLGVAVVMAIQVVRMIRNDGYWTSGPTWAAACLVASIALTGLYFGVAAVARRPLVGGDGPWLLRYGWLVVIGLALLSFLASMALPDQAYKVFPNGPALFVPLWIRQLEESYREGVKEARQEARIQREG
jgi:hypothetical protein